ncbi:MAG: FAD-dependent oxidoreductase [Polyangiaceae bacterium]
MQAGSARHHVLVVGGGFAGLAAATVLAESGVRVTLAERDAELGGRAATTIDRLRDGTTVEFGRGAFFIYRHYENTRALLSRVDPRLDMLVQAGDVAWLDDRHARSATSLSNLPTRAPARIVALARRLGGVGVMDLARARLGALSALQAFDAERTFATLDAESAGDFLRSARLPVGFTRALYDHCAQAAWYPPSALSAAELACSIHFHFTSNRHGLEPMAARQALGASVFRPLGRYLGELGAEVLTKSECEELESSGLGFKARVRARGVGRSVEADAVVLAVPLDVAARLSAGLRAPSGSRIEDPGAIEATSTVLRLWLDRRPNDARATLTRLGNHDPLRSITLVDRFDIDARRFAHKVNGAVIELASYAAPPPGATPSLARTTPPATRDALVAALREVFPELLGARILDERLITRRDPVEVGPGLYRRRPAVKTAVPGLFVAGEGVRLAQPSALAERAVTSGFEAATHLLEGWGARPSDIVRGPTNSRKG